MTAVRQHSESRGCKDLGYFVKKATPRRSSNHCLTIVNLVKVIKMTKSNEWSGEEPAHRLEGKTSLNFSNTFWPALSTRSVLQKALHFANWIFRHRRLKVSLLFAMNGQCTIVLQPPAQYYSFVFRKMWSKGFFPATWQTFANTILSVENL